MSMSDLDKYLLHPFTTLLATGVLVIVFHNIGLDWLAVLAFAGFFMNFYFWYNRNVKGRARNETDLPRASEIEEKLARIARNELEGTRVRRITARKQIALITKTVRGRLSE